MYTKKGKGRIYYSITIKINDEKTSYIATEYQWIQKCNIPFLWVSVDDFPPIEYYIPLNKIDSLSIQEI